VREQPAIAYAETGEKTLLRLLDAAFSFRQPLRTGRTQLNDMATTVAWIAAPTNGFSGIETLPMLGKRTTTRRARIHRSAA
jgi:hypothetical protein